MEKNVSDLSLSDTLLQVWLFFQSILHIHTSATHLRLHAVLVIITNIIILIIIIIIIVHGVNQSMQDSQEIKCNSVFFLKDSICTVD